MTDTELKAALRPLLKKAFEAGRQAAQQPQARTFAADSDDSPQFRPPFGPADAKNYAHFYGDDDGVYPGSLHRHFGMGKREFSEATGLRLRWRDGRGWEWVRASE
jgi:hypothetical protein